MSGTWSAISKLSLSEISNISVIALPITLNDVSKSSWYKYSTQTGVSGDTFPLDTTYNIAVLGECEVGKSSIITALCFGRSEEAENYSMLDLEYYTSILVDGVKSHLRITDTPGLGSGEYAVLVNEAIRNSDAFILVYSMTDRSSFFRIQSLYEAITSVKQWPHTKRRPVVIVANKADLEESHDISPELPFSLAAKLNCALFECSVKSDSAVARPFIELVRFHKYPLIARGLLATGNEIDDILRNQERLSRYFNQDEGNRFDMEGVIGAGQFGVTWKIKYRASATDIPIGSNPRSSQPGPGLGLSVRHIVLKTDRTYSYREDEMEDDDDEDDGGDGDDGDDEDEILRMCIAMGWPPNKPDGVNPQPVLETSQGAPYGGIIHGDMHHSNLMFGDFIPEDPGLEHTLTPILKLIDLGSVRKVVDFREEIVNAVRENIFDIGVMMVELITLNPDLADRLFPGAPGAKPFRMKPNGPEIMTYGGPLLPDKNNVNPYPGLDTGLRDLRRRVSKPGMNSFIQVEA
ncbi:hypothetical protein E0Z10_g9168 [Xylaria hypoxylon]|uniref:Uncharacterized protein n=1 Tax=Xylaria hypoxylon TaxID=37992 RepID=A0A4Z0YL54_9PEZI|nr:hypothetical protein E0Z10_g9168 [Xylaria hypoxylon]